ELEAQVRDARAALRGEREEHARQVAETTAELQRARQEVESAQEKLRQERDHLSELHERLRSRHADHWKAAETALRKREDQLEAERRKRESDRAALTDARLRFNGETELGRRQLQDGWDGLRRAQRQWDERRRRVEGELQRRDRELTEAERGL